MDSNIKNERERLAVLINNLAEATFVTDSSGKILLFNANALTLLSTTMTLSGQDLSQVLPLFDQSKNSVDLFRLVEENVSVHRTDLNFVSVDGTHIVLDLTFARVRVRVGQKPDFNYVLICRDITKAKSLDQQREEFIAVISHELRTPLAIAEAALSTALLPSMNMPPAIGNLIKQAYRNVVFLGDVVTDLSTLAEAENGTLRVKPEIFDIKALISQLVADYLPNAIEKNLELKAIYGEGTSNVLSTEHYVREILQNYLVNAIKYTPKGQIILKCEPAKAGGVLFSIQDPGIGISVSDQKHLFTRFYRSEDYRTRKTGGTGLGLYLCQELAERLNAKVWCISRLNHGSIFYLELPKAPKQLKS